MTEPEYTYVKGQGWVIGPRKITHRVVCYNGKTITLTECSNPGPDDYFYVIDTVTSALYNLGRLKVNYQALLNWHKSNFTQGLTKGPKRMGPNDVGILVTISE